MFGHLYNIMGNYLRRLSCTFHRPVVPNLLAANPWGTGSKGRYKGYLNTYIHTPNAS